MLVLHFAKRVLEVMYVHQYSGNMGPACYAIGTFYGLLTLLCCVQTGNVPAALYDSPASALALPLSLLLFVVGQLGNGYHHGRAVQVDPVFSQLTPRLLSTPDTKL